MNLTAALIGLRKHGLVKRGECKRFPSGEWQLDADRVLTVVDDTPELKPSDLRLDVSVARTEEYMPVRDEGGLRHGVRLKKPVRIKHPIVFLNVHATDKRSHGYAYALTPAGLAAAERLLRGASGNGHASGSAGELVRNSVELWRITVALPPPPKDIQARRRLENTALTPQELIEQERRARAAAAQPKRDVRLKGRETTIGWVPATGAAEGEVTIEVRVTGERVELDESDPSIETLNRSAWNRIQERYGQLIGLRLDQGWPVVTRADGTLIMGQRPTRYGTRSAASPNAQQPAALPGAAGPLGDTPEAKPGDGQRRDEGATDSRPADRLKPSHAKAKALHEWATEHIDGAEKMTYAEVFEKLQNDPRCAGEGLPNNAEAFARYCRAAGVYRNAPRRAKGPTRSIRRASDL